jgi:competence protein ComEC
MISPDSDFVQSGELNDTGLVELVKTPQLTSLFTADTGSNVEDSLLANHADLRADILKIPHHGSKYASNSDFLRAVDPKIAVIEVGAKNSFGQPSKEALAHIASSTKAKIFRTDEDGTITITTKDGEIEVLKEK